MRATIFTALTETHHDYNSGSRDDFVPLKKGDTVRLFHGFREARDAVRLARNGLSGASRVGRVYSYESDNNPKGLFVTLSRRVADNFVGSYPPRTMVEFNAKVEDLDAPVWPNGSYTVQGQMAAYWGHGHEGVRKRRAQQKNLRQDSKVAEPHIRDSDDPAVASTLFFDPEMQALFVGHLNPSDITCFWVEETRGDWKSYDREEYLSRFASAGKEDDRDYHRIFTAGEDFDGNKFLAHLKDSAGSGVESTLENLWRDVLKAPVQGRARRFLGYFEIYLWPKQYILCMQWMAQRYGKKTPITEAQEEHDFDYEGWSEDVDADYEQDMKTAHLPATVDNIHRAKDFLMGKWVEWHQERGNDHPEDLSNSCKFSSLFAREVFGGRLRGNHLHQFVELPNGQILDLNIDARDVLNMGAHAHHHDDELFWGNPEHKESLDSCRPRVAQWVAEFITSI